MTGLKILCDLPNQEYGKFGGPLHFPCKQQLLMWVVAFCVFIWNMFADSEVFVFSPLKFP